GRCYELELVAAQLAQLDGRLQEAEVHARQALALGGGAAAIRLETAEARLALIMVDRGASLGAQRVAERALAQRAARGSLARAGLLLARAAARAAQGAPRDALADAEAAGEVLAATRVESPVAAPWRSTAALALHALGDRRRARA